MASCFGPIPDRVAENLWRPDTIEDPPQWFFFPPSQISFGEVRFNKGGDSSGLRTFSTLLQTVEKSGLWESPEGDESLIRDALVFRIFYRFIEASVKISRRLTIVIPSEASEDSPSKLPRKLAKTHHRSSSGSSQRFITETSPRAREEDFTGSLDSGIGPSRVYRSRYHPRKGVRLTNNHPVRARRDLGAVNDLWPRWTRAPWSVVIAGIMHVVAGYRRQRRAVRSKVHQVFQRRGGYYACPPL